MLRFSINLLLISLPFFSCFAQNVSREKPQAISGVIDLTDWDFEKDGPVDLSGEYEFYWNQHLAPDSFTSNVPPEKTGFIEVPGTWKGYRWHEQKLPGTGYATYRLTLLLKNSDHKLAFKFLDMGTAYTVFTNGDTLLTIGKIGTTPETTIPRYFPQVIDFLPDSNRIDLVFHVSNFHHKRGGAWEIIKLGAKKQIYEIREKRLAFVLVLFGSIFIMGLYHLALFTLRKKDLSAIYFGLFCLLIAIRMLTTVERYLLQIFPGMPWELFVKIEYLSYLLSVPAFALFLRSLFSKDTHRPILLAILIISVAFSAVVLLTPARFFTHINVLSQVFLLMCLVYAVSLLILCVHRKRQGAAIFLAGFLFLAVTVVNDILDANGIIQTGHLVHVGLFIFIFSQSFLLSFRFSKAFKTVDLQRHELVKEIEERKRAEKENLELHEKLTRSQKMEAIGLLAGGVAHDLNNILTGMVTYPDLLLMDLPKNSHLKEPLETIKNSGQKAAAVVQDLLTLARRGVIHHEVLNLNHLVKEYLNSPEHQKLQLYHPNVEIETHLEQELTNIKGSPFHLKKTIMNLVSNAAEAQPNGGKISLKTENRYLETFHQGYENIKEGDYVVLIVSDKGLGIDREDLSKIFEPFYTKKVMGRSGTGLGMTVVWNTVHDHDGYIDIETSIGHGTSFELYFQATSEEIVRKGPTPIEELMGNNERILVVDDRKEQREVASRILTRLGYVVDTVPSGEAAVAYMEEKSADLLLLDMIMDPGIDGLETFRQIQKHHPKIKAVIASGYSETDRVKQAQVLGAGSYIKKPYTLEKIGMAVKTELNKSHNLSES